MKKVIIAAILLLAISDFAQAQEAGIRLGNFSAGNVAVDGVFSFGEWNRVHADVAFGSAGVGVDALWDFAYNSLDRKNFFWYGGAGVSALFGDYFMLGVAGEIGVEYKFDFPVTVGFDWRPVFTIIEFTDLELDNFGLNARYRF